MKILFVDGKIEKILLLLLKFIILKSKFIKILWDVIYVVFKGKECINKVR